MGLKLNNNNGEKVIDPYNSKELYKRHSCKLDSLSEENKSLIHRYLDDMELGKNVDGIKGYRSYVRLLNLRHRISMISGLFQERFSKNLNQITEDDIVRLFKDMREGIIKKKDGGIYKSTADYVKVFKAFWHWYQKAMKKEGKIVEDITNDLDTSREKAKFNYVSIENLKVLCDNAKYDYKVLMQFLFDTGIRAPTELMNVKVKDIEFLGNVTTLTIRDETSKTFGRKIKLMLCADVLKKYIDSKNLKGDDFVFQISPPTVNQYLRRLGTDLLNMKNLTLYDFRHSSACYWVSKYKSESTLKYKFGWKKSDMIYYYTEHRGLSDNITQDDLIDAETKTLLQKELEQQKQQNLLLQDRLNNMESQIKLVLEKLQIFNLK